MITTYKFKLYNNKRNRRLKSLINIAGLIYNHCIALHKRYYRLCGKYIHKYALMKHLVKLKKTKRFGFFRKLDAQAIHDIVKRIDRAYHLFWANLKRGVKASSPNFKKIKCYTSFTLELNSWKLDESSAVITIQKRRYRYIKTRNVSGRIKTVTVKRDSLGDVYIHLVCDAGSRETLLREGKKVGYDFGLKTFLTASDGHDIEHPLFFIRNIKKLAMFSRNLSHKQPGSKRRERARKAKARMYKRLADLRADFHYKTARTICSKYAFVALEKLNIKGMAKLWGRKVSDLGFYNFVQILKYEAAKMGTRVMETDMFYPSSQICSACGNKNSDIRNFRIRSWVCPECGKAHDRDRNAAINILRFCEQA